MTTIFPVISLLFGAGGIGYAIVARMLDRKKYDQEVRCSQADADLKGEEFWKGRYDTLMAELDKRSRGGRNATTTSTKRFRTNVSYPTK